MQANHETTDICLACIRQCQMESPYLNFVSLLGQKYGWRGSPNSYVLRALTWGALPGAQPRMSACNASVKQV